MSLPCIALYSQQYALRECNSDLRTQVDHVGHNITIFSGEFPPKIFVARLLQDGAGEMLQVLLFGWRSIHHFLANSPRCSRVPS